MPSSAVRSWSAWVQTIRRLRTPRTCGRLYRMRFICGAVLTALLLVPASAAAQDAGGQPQPAPAPPDPRDVADRRPNFVEPDFTLVNLPTTLRLPRYKSAFRI